MTVKGGTSQACAACKYQRRKCSSECPLSPYFPASKPKMFLNAHRLFGVCNIMKILRQLGSQEQKDEAMKSIIYESNMRDKFPVHGCYGIICELHYQLVQSIEELQYVHAQLAIKEESHNQIVDDHSELQLGMNAMTLDANHCVYVESNGIAKVENPYYYNMTGNIDPVAIQSQLISPQDYDDIPFNAMADDRKSYIDLKEADESSFVASWKEEPVEHVSKNELKTAAACFSLTSVN